MEIKYKHIFIAFAVVLILMCLSLYQINRFMNVLPSCEDDFETIERCGCVPCSWANADKVNGNKQCELVKKSGLKNINLSVFEDG